MERERWARMACTAKGVLDGGDDAQPAEGLPNACVANLDTITTIPRRTLAHPIGLLSPDKLAAVDRALMFALGLANRPA